MRRIVSFSILALLFVWLGFYLQGHLHEFRDIKYLSWHRVALLLFFVLFYYITQGLILKTVVRPFNVKLGFKEWFGTLMVTLLGNYIVPFGGFGFRAAYLKKVHSLDYTYFVSTLAATYVAEFLIFTFGGLVALIFSYIRSGNFDLRLIIMLSIVLSVCGSVVLFSPRLPQLNYVIWERIQSALEGWYSIKANQRLMGKLFYLTTIEFLLYTAVFYLVFQALKLNVSYFDAFLPACLSDYAFLIRITPASLGFYEGAVVYSSKFFGLTIAQGLLVVGIIRIIGIFWIFSLGPIFSHLLTNQSKKE